MTILRRLARPMLASVFVVGGADTLRNPEPRVQMAESVTPKLASALPIPDDTEQLVKINAGVQVAAGVLLAIGRFPRLSAAVLAGSLVPTTYAGHRFWEEDEEMSKATQRIHFLKNLGLLGGLLLAVVDTGGAPSIGWRARRAARRLQEVSSAAIDALPVG
ncbi:MAG: DoxX family protein [Acidimicrobiales bacterium]